MSLSKAIIKIFKAQVFVEGGGFKVRRSVGAPEMPTLDPWVLMDHFGPVNHPPGTAVGAPDHPHSGLEIMTYVLRGGNLHHDTLGNEITTHRGQSMLMHAGDGLVHSELAVDEIHENGGEVEVFQIWYTLPKAMRMGKPTFLKVDTKDQGTRLDKSGKVKVKVLYGSTIINGEEFASKVKGLWPVTYLDFHIRPYGKFSHKCEGGFTTLIYCYRGSMFVSTDEKNEQHLTLGDQAQIISSEPVTVHLRAGTENPGRVILLSAKPHGEEIYKYRGLVASSEEELETIKGKAYSGGLGTIPGADERRKKTEASLAKMREYEATHKS